MEMFSSILMRQMRRIKLFALNNNKLNKVTLFNFSFSTFSLMF